MGSFLLWLGPAHTLPLSRPIRPPKRTVSDVGMWAGKVRLRMAGTLQCATVDAAAGAQPDARGLRFVGPQRANARDASAVILSSDTRDNTMFDQNIVRRHP